MLSVGRKEDARVRTANVARRAYASGREALAQGDLDMARAAFRWARRADPGNPLYIHGEAAVACRTGNYHEAEHLYRRVLDLATRAFGAGDPRVAVAARGLIELREEHGQEEEAWSLGEYILDSLDRDAAAQTGVTVLSALVNICDTTARLGDAVDIHRRALAWRIRTFGEDHYKVHECNIAIAELNRLIEIRGPVPQCIAAESPRQTVAPRDMAEVAVQVYLN